MFELLEVNKNADDQTMRDACYTKLKENQSEKLKKVEDSKDSWDKYWDEVVQIDVCQFLLHIINLTQMLIIGSILQARQQYQVRRAHHVRKIKTAMINVLGKVMIGDVPKQKASKEEIINWKTSPAMLEAKAKLWQPVDTAEDADPQDTYIRHIMTDVWRDNRSKVNQQFAIAVIDMMFDPTITTTSLTGDEIAQRMQAQAQAAQLKKTDAEKMEIAEDSEEEVFRNNVCMTFLTWLLKLGIFSLLANSLVIILNHYLFPLSLVSLFTLQLTLQLALQLQFQLQLQNTL